MPVGSPCQIMINKGNQIFKFNFLADYRNTLDVSACDVWWRSWSVGVKCDGNLGCRTYRLCCGAKEIENLDHLRVNPPGADKPFYKISQVHLSQESLPTGVL